MASTKQRAANRANAQHSTGPKTVQGKARSSANSLRHGLFARETLLKDEPAELFEAFRDEMLSDLAPLGMREEILADRIVGLEWRLRRLWVVERENLEELQEGTDIAGQPVKGSVGQAFRKGSSSWQDNPLGKLSRYETSLSNSLSRSYASLDQLQSIRKSTTQEKLDSDN